MTAQTFMLTQDDLDGLISSEIASKLHGENLEQLARFARSSLVWVGYYDGKLKAVWGLMPPVLMAEQAYLWLHVPEPLGDSRFAFVRHSQKAIEVALRHFPQIVGHCERKNHQARRWLEWLGAEFIKAPGPILSFVIKERHGPRIAS